MLYIRVRAKRVCSAITNETNAISNLNERYKRTLPKSNANSLFKPKCPFCLSDFNSALDPTGLVGKVLAQLGPVLVHGRQPAPMGRFSVSRRRSPGNAVVQSIPQTLLLPHISSSELDSGDASIMKPRSPTLKPTACGGSMP